MTEPLDPTRLAKICEMLRSDNPNERAIAGERATVLLKRAGMTWTSFIDAACASKIPGGGPPIRPRPAAPSSARASAPPPPPPRPDKLRTTERNGRQASDVIAELLTRLDDFPGWEQMFVKSLQNTHHYGLAESQWKILDAMLKTKKRRRKSPTRRSPQR